MIPSIELRVRETFVMTLPYPVSANRYWRPVRVGAGITIVPTAEAKAYKADVLARARAAGIRSPIVGRVTVTVSLYPAMPLDGPRRMARDPSGWDDTVRAIDLDNSVKIILDAIKGIVIEDDKWVRRIVAERFEPDGTARVELRVERFVARDIRGDVLLSDTGAAASIKLTI